MFVVKNGVLIKKIVTRGKKRLKTVNIIKKWG